jgi:hypothetical protein
VGFFWLCLNLGAHTLYVPSAHILHIQEVIMKKTVNLTIIVSEKLKLEAMIQQAKKLTPKCCY